MPEPRRFVRLPLYPWQRERFWHEAEESRVSRLDAAGPPAARRRAGRATARLGGAARPAPGAVPRRPPRAARGDPARGGLSGAGLRGGREAFGAIGCELRDVKLANPCFLAPDEPLRLQTTFDPDHGDGPGPYASRSGRPRMDGPPDRGPASPPGRGRREPCSRPTRSVDRCPREFSREQCYDYLRTIGLDYGPMFQGIERVWQGDRESLGLVRAPRCPRAGERRVPVPPGLARRLPPGGHPGRRRLRPAQRRPVPAA